MRVIKFKNKNFIKYFFFIGWIFIWGTLSFDPETFQFSIFDLIKKNEFGSIFNLIRGSLSIIIGLFLAILAINKFEKKKLFKNNDLTFFLFLILFFFQSLPYMSNDYPIYNLYYLYNSILSLVILNFLIKYFNKIDLEIILYINIIFLLLISLVFGAKYLISFLVIEGSFYSMWGNIKHSIIGEIPRATGLSRTFLIIYIFVSLFHTEIRHLIILKKILKIISVFFIILLSSRTTYFLFILFLFLNLFWLNRNKSEFYEILIYTIIIPGILILSIILHKEINFKQKKLDDISISSNIRTYTKYRPDRPQTDFSSGRFYDWKKIINNNEKIFFGNGVMGDRIIISQSASNGILYVYVSSGLIGVMIFVFLSIILFYKSIKIIIFNIQSNHNIKLISAILIIAMLLRSILETSYALFGIDFLILSSSLAILIKLKEK